MNTFNLSGQQGTAAKMSYEYIVPSTKWPPVQGLPQNLQTIRAVQPSKQPMHTGVKKLDFPSNFTCKIQIFVKIFYFLKKVSFFLALLECKSCYVVWARGKMFRWSVGTDHKRTWVRYIGHKALCSTCYWPNWTRWRYGSHRCQCCIHPPFWCGKSWFFA